MDAINKGKRVWVIYGNGVERGVVTSSYLYALPSQLHYRVRFGKNERLSRIAGFDDRDVFLDEQEACARLAARLQLVVDSLVARSVANCG